MPDGQVNVKLLFAHTLRCPEGSEEVTLLRPHLDVLTIADYVVPFPAFHSKFSRMKAAISGQQSDSRSYLTRGSSSWLNWV